MNDDVAYRIDVEWARALTTDALIRQLLLVLSPRSIRPPTRRAIVEEAASRLAAYAEEKE